jgi:hypothetical protein
LGQNSTGVDIAIALAAVSSGAIAIGAAAVGVIAMIDDLNAHVDKLRGTAQGTQSDLENMFGIKAGATASGWEDTAAATGTRSFVESATGRRGINEAERAREQYRTLSASIAENTTYQRALALAYTQSQDAVDPITAAQKAYEQGQRLGKGATDEMRLSIAAQYLEFEKAETAVKNAQQAQRNLNDEADYARRLYEETLTPLQKYDDAVAKITDAWRQGAIDAKTYSGALATLNKDLQTKTESLFGKELSTDLTSFAGKIANVFTDARNSSKSFKNQVLANFQDLAKQIEDLLIKTFVTGPIQQALQGLLGGGGASGGFLSTFSGLFGGGAGAAGAAAGSAESGGSLVTIGGEIAGGVGSFQYGGIIDSPLGHDEVPIIAHRGEAIIPASQVRAGALGGGPRVYQQFTIQTPHANSFRAAQSHIMADAHKQALAAAVNPRGRGRTGECRSRRSA